MGNIGTGLAVGLNAAAFIHGDPLTPFPYRDNARLDDSLFGKFREKEFSAD